MNFCMAMDGDNIYLSCESQGHRSNFKVTGVKRSIFECSVFRIITDESQHIAWSYIMCESPASPF